MPSNLSTPKRTARQQIAFESRREREFYSYYEPIRSLSDTPPTLCDLHDQEAVRAHRPSSSPDKALTAFAQLAALRLHTRRAMLFFFDANYAYVLAEATRTLSLLDDSRHDVEDGLWLGATMIPRGFSVCEFTVNLPANEGSNSGDPASASIVHIINDLREDTRFCDRPYVKGGPMARFYAGVPITTPKGINIGAFCVLDDKTRDGLAESEVRFLREMATTTMTHLENIRARAENQRSRDMTGGLGAFIEGRSSLSEWWLKSDTQRPRKSSKSAMLDHHKAALARRERASDDTGVAPIVGLGTQGSLHTRAGSTVRSSLQQASTSYPLPPPVYRSSQPLSVSTEEMRAGALEVADGGIVSKKSVGEPDSEKAHRAAGDLQEEMLSNDVRSTFNRAAGILREALDVDGTLFLDASIGTFGGLVARRHCTDLSTDPSGASDHGSSTSGSKPTRASMSTPDKPCSIFGAAFSATEERSHDQDPTSHLCMSEKFLRSLLRRYPHGRIWNFNEDGDASSDEFSEEGRSGLSAGDGDGDGDGQGADQEPKGPSKRKRKRKWTSIKDGRTIQSLFPGVRSLIMVGMWDSHRDRWYAGAIVWTYSPIRVLSAGSEFTYLAAFADIVMAEVWRLDAQKTDRAKTDFISSISHELRSPLHGILGSVECLQDQEHDPMTEELIRSINSCGTTLLDIISHLLEYARINRFSRASHSASDSNPRNRRIVSSALRSNSSSKLSGMMALDVDVSLDALTEDVVETACTGFLYRRFSADDHNHTQSQTRHDVSVVLDINKPADSGWLFRVRAGAWRRICINLLSNALKYTQTGYIRVILRAAPLPAKSRKPPGAMVTLTISDSGIGMSRAFLNTQCFKPFQQENSLVEGTGLGLNLVAAIVEAQGGTVDVQSEKGAGTEVKVVLPLEYSPVRNDSNGSNGSSQSVVSTSTSALAGVTLGLMGFEDPEETIINGPNADSKQKGRLLLCDSLRNTCSGLGIHTYVFHGLVDLNASLHLVTEREALSLCRRHGKDHGTDERENSLKRVADLPLIILCDTATSARKLKSAHVGGLLGSRIEYISQPAGPAKVARAISACLSSAAASPGRRTRLRSQETQNNVSTAVMRDALSEGADVHNPDGATLSIPSRDDHPLRRQGTGDSESLSPLSIKNDLEGLAPSKNSATIPSLHVRYMAPSESYPFPRIPDKPLDRPSRSTPDQRISECAPALEPFMPSPAGPATRPRAASARTTTSPRKQPSFTREGTNPIPLLLVDDNRINLQLLLTYAKKYSHPYITAQNGLEAVEAYKRATESVRGMPNTPGGMHCMVNGMIVDTPQKPRVVLMDINMPVMSGFEATRAIRTYEQESGVKPATIIALTGLGSADAQQEAYSSGVDLFLTKPVSLKELTKILDGLNKA